MLSVAEALAVVLQHAHPLSTEVVPLTSTALGLVLAEEIVSDLDMPPFDRVMMDGYAVRSVDLPEGRGELAVVEEVHAGRPPQRTIGKGEASWVATGAPLPEGADAVVMVEKTQKLEGGRVAVSDAPPKPGQHFAPRAQEIKTGETVLKAGAVIGPAEFGLLATVGRTAATVFPAPRVAVIATGDELVEAVLKPKPGQVRNSNGPMLTALTVRAGGVPQFLGIVPDEATVLRSRITEGLRGDVLILAGGVSAGERDLVPAVLREVGIVEQFHHVAMKPGKPLLFGVGPRGKLVFALPGNPVSAFVCFHLFVAPALRQLANRAEPGPNFTEAKLAEDFPVHSDRPVYHPAVVEESADGPIVRPSPWLGSPDLRALTRSNALVVFPPSEKTPTAGQTFSVLRIDR